MLPVEHIKYIFILTLSYLLGSIPFGYIIGQLYGKNLRAIGSGNIGATNAVRMLGFRSGALVFLLDFLKCFLPVFLIKYFYNEDFAVISGCIIILGHIFSIYLRFAGGKGVASLVGLYWGIDFVLGGVFTASWFISFKIWRYPFLASLISSVSTLIFALIINNFYIGVETTSFRAQGTLALILITILIVLKHYSNIRKFIEGQEEKL